MIDTLPEKYVVFYKAFGIAKKFSMDAEKPCLKNLKAAKPRGKLQEDAV